MLPSLCFQWLGVGGLVFLAEGEALAIDPFFSRPPLRCLFLGRPEPDLVRVVRYLPRCNHVLVTHAHWDHVMDVPAVLRNTGACAYGSANTLELLVLHDTSEAQAKPIAIGDRLSLGPFEVEVVPGRHPPVPFFPGSGPLRTGLRPPLRLVDYRMDECLGFSIRTQGVHMLISPAHGRPADILFVGIPAALLSPRRLLAETRPRLVVPMHWDNLFKPLPLAPSAPKRPRPPALRDLASPFQGRSAGALLLIPDRFRVYDLAELL